MKIIEHLPLRSGLVFLLWLAAMSNLAAGLAASIRETSANGYFPVAVVGLCLGWVFSRLRVKTIPAWAAILVIGAVFSFVHNGELTQPIDNFTREGVRYGWQIIESRFDDFKPNAENWQNAQTELASASSGVWVRMATWIQNVRAGAKDEDALARQIVWSLAALALAAWAGWILPRRKQALIALLPTTGLLAYLQYYSQPAALNFLLHLLLLLMLAALTEGSHALHSLSADTLTAAFLVSIVILFAAGVTPSISVRSVAKAVEQSAQTEQNDSTARSLGLESGRTPHQYVQPGLPRERLIEGAPHLSQTVIFTVSTGDLPPMPRLPREETPPNYYWRTITYDTYTGRGWAVTLNASRDERPNTLLLDALPSGYRLVKLDVQKMEDMPSLPWTGELVRADQAIHTAWRTLPDSRARSLDPLRGADLIAAASNVRTAHIESTLPNFSVGQLRASSANYPDWVRAQYLNLPDELPQRVRDLAIELTANQPTAYDRAAVIEAYLRKFPYTLNVPAPPADRDVADYFLFDLQKGYCDYYATAMVALARAAGMPARLVTGYASGVYVPPEAYYRVRESDAHSWVEIYFTGLGWVEFEPTANRPLIPHTEGQSTPAPEIPLNQQFPAAPEPWAVTFLRRIRPFTWPILLTGVLICAGVIAATEMLRERRRRNAPVETIAEIYRQVYRLGHPLTGETRHMYTPLTFAGSLEKRLGLLPTSKRLRTFLAPAKAEVAALTDLYVRAIYSPLPPTREETIQALRMWRRLIWRLRLMKMISGRAR